MDTSDMVVLYVQKVTIVLCFTGMLSKATFGCEFQGPYIELDLGSEGAVGQQQKRTIARYIGQYTAPPDWSSLTILQKRENYKKHMEEKQLQRPIYLGPKCDLCIKQSRAKKNFDVKIRRKDGPTEPVLATWSDPSKNTQLCETEDEMGQLIAVSQSLELFIHRVYKMWKDKDGILRSKTEELPPWAKLQMGHSQTHTDRFSQYYLGGFDQLVQTSVRGHIVYGQRKVELIVPLVRAKLLVGNADICGYRLRKELERLSVELLQNYRAVLCDTGVDLVKVFGKQFNVALTFRKWPDGRKNGTVEINDRKHFLKKIEDVMKNL